MWEELPDLTKAEESGLRGLKRVKLYADEDIEDEVVEFLRGKKVNIKSARELGHRGKPDSFQAAFAYKKKRFLLTKNVKHYMDDKKFPFHRQHGIIAVDGDMGDTPSYLKTLMAVISLIPYGTVYEGMKIRVSRDEIFLKGINSKGKLTGEEPNP